MKCICVIVSVAHLCKKVQYCCQSSCWHLAIGHENDINDETINLFCDKTCTNYQRSTKCTDTDTSQLSITDLIERNGLVTSHLDQGTISLKDTNVPSNSTVMNCREREPKKKRIITFAIWCPLTDKTCRQLQCNPVGSMWTEDGRTRWRNGSGMLCAHFAYTLFCGRAPHANHQHFSSSEIFVH